MIRKKPDDRQGRIPMLENLKKMPVLLLLLIIPRSISLAAQEPSPYFTAQDYFHLVWISDPQISPDGARIIYVRNFADIKSDKFYSNLWIINFDGSGNRPLTTGLSSDKSPRWSPDGSQILYISDKGGAAQLYKRGIDADRTVPLTDMPVPPMNPAWSPDGKQVVFSTVDLSAPPTIAVLPPPPSEATWAPPPVVIDRALYRLDGIGYVPGYLHLYIIPSEGGTPRKITEGKFNHSGGEWTPDGKHLIFSADRRDNWEITTSDAEVFEMDISDGKIRALTDRRGDDSSPTASPDGKYIAYTGYNEKFQADNVAELYVMNSDGTAPRSLTRNLDRSVNLIKWASDSQGLYFLYDDKGHTWLASVSLDGRVKKLAGNIGDGRTPYGIILGASYTMAPNGHFAFTYSRPDHPSDLAVGTVQTSEVKIITSVNEDIPASKKLGAVEEIWYPCSKDGRQIQGWIVKPPDFSSSRKYPLILEIHGGPWNNYGDRFSLEHQLLASAGYVVFYPNYRGSTSYGEEFSNLTSHTFPSDDYYDLIAGVDEVIKKGYIDEDNIFITGGSAGGTLTCWCIGKTDRFRAAAALYPVVNWYSLVLTSDIGNAGIKNNFPGFPWDHSEYYMKYSPLSLVGNVKTPTILITGEQDFRTPISESEQYYMGLKLNGVESVLVRFPEESHGIYSRPSHHLSKIQHVIGWFDKHRISKTRTSGRR
jgi:dipeptidyl aminopeptidase/acylaminoacyl peptidase